MEKRCDAKSLRGAYELLVIHKLHEIYKQIGSLYVSDPFSPCQLYTEIRSFECAKSKGLRPGNSGFDEIYF